VSTIATDSMVADVLTDHLVVSFFKRLPRHSMGSSVA
jgi:hypothetical protein